MCSYAGEGHRHRKAAARGQVKAMVLKGDDHTKDMITLSVYDTKPLHFISTTTLSLK